MATPFFSLSVRGSVLYAKMPGGSVKLPLQKNERDDVIAALKEAIEIIEDDLPSPCGGATESG